LRGSLPIETHPDPVGSVLDQNLALIAKVLPDPSCSDFCESWHSHKLPPSWTILSRKTVSQPTTIESIAQYVPDGSHGRLAEAIIDWQNAQFLEGLNRNVQRGLHDPGHQGYLAEKIQIGVKNGDSPHYTSIWILDPELVPRVQKAWEMRTHDATHNETDRATCVFSSTNSYACMFRNRTYLGIRKRGESWDRHPRRVGNLLLTS
jgi:hypothetical protein